MSKLFFHSLLILIGGLFLFFVSPQKNTTKDVSQQKITEANFSSCKASYECFSIQFKLNLHQQGIKNTLAKMKILSENNPTVRNLCHSLAHDLGREAYSLTSEDVGRIFREGDTTCWSGFFHGALEKAFSHSKDLAATAQGLCTESNGVKGNFLYYQCLHGLGHGLSARFDNDIYQALAVCEKLEDSYEQNSCYGGTFMENYVADPATGHTSKYLSADDPIAPCNKVAEKFKYNCYQLVSIQILKLNSYDFAAAFATCEQSEPDFLEVCYQSVGRDASGYTAEDPDKALSLCYLGNSRAQDACVRAVASDSVYSKSSVDFVKATCQKARTELKNACYEAVGAAVAVLFDSKNDRVTACVKMEVSFVAVCKKTAGIS